MLHSVLGQPGATALFARLVARDRLPHAVVLEGLPGCGRRTLARALAMALLCPQRSAGDACGVCEHCQQVQQGSHPDLVELPGDQDPIPDGWEGGVEAQRLIPVEWVRERIGERAYESSLLGVGRVFILPAAERIRGAAANALLKVLEEPPPRTWLLLTAASVHALLPTIRSRSQTYRLQALSQRDVEAVLRRQGVAGHRAATLAARSSGSHRGLTDVAGEVPLDQLRTLLRGLDLAACAQVVAALPQKGGDEERSVAAEQRRVLRVWLSALEGTLRAELRAAQAALAAQAVDGLERIAQARSDLDRNLGPRVVLEGLALGR